MNIYGLANHLVAVILTLTTFATRMRSLFSRSTANQFRWNWTSRRVSMAPTRYRSYFQIYLPLMAPALVAVGTYALLLAWNEYLYNFLLLSTPASMTVAVALAQFLNSDESPWNYMMATAIIYSVPPIILYYGFRRHMVAGLTMGGVKG